METVDSAIRRKPSPLAVAARIAGPQHGVVARGQLLGAGLSRDVVDRMVGAGSLVLLYRGVYAVGHRPVGVRSREMAVALMTGVRAVSRHSALAMWAMSRPWHGPVHALGPKARSGPGYVIHRTRHLPPTDITTHWGIPVTTPLRTLLDLSSTLSLDALDAALAEALVRRLVRLEHVRERAATGALAQLVNTAAPTKSKLERDLRKILHERGLPQPISNGIVCGYEVDLHWPGHQLVAELDGYEFHGHRRAFETDRERDIVLAAAGHRTVRLTAAQLERRATVAERFSALLRAPALPGAA